MRRAWNILVVLGLTLWPLLLLIGCRADPPSSAPASAAAARERFAGLVAEAEAGSGHGDRPVTPGPDVEATSPEQAMGSPCSCVTGGECLCEANGCACVCGPKPGHEVFREFQSPCVLVFGARWCDPCRWADIHIVPELQRKGWTVEHIDADSDHWMHEACAVEGLPLFICVRRGVECGRYQGTDRGQLFAMLRHALALRFPEDQP
jgi:hypothetical protein